MTDSEHQDDRPGRVESGDDVVALVKALYRVIEARFEQVRRALVRVDQRLRDLDDRLTALEVQAEEWRN